MGVDDKMATPIIKEAINSEQAVEGHVAEVTMTLAQGLRKSWKATLWSAFLSIAVIMEGYDAILLSSLFGLPAFKEDFGTQNSKGVWNVSAKWQSSVTQGVKVGQFFGLFIAGWAADRFGFKKTTLFTCIITVGLIFMQFFCTSIGMLVAAQVLFGFPLAVFLTLSTVYAAEICPLVLRPYLTTWVNLCWTIGKLLSAGVLRGFVNTHSQWGYRIPFATQWIFGHPLCFSAPCSCQNRPGSWFGRTGSRTQGRASGGCTAATRPRRSTKNSQRSW
jgi:SP family general alpha glucoside:H+ symporter-like MFS transporter